MRRSGCRRLSRAVHSRPCNPLRRRGAKGAGIQAVDPVSRHQDDLDPSGFAVGHVLGELALELGQQFPHVLHVARIAPPARHRGHRRRLVLVEGREQALAHEAVAGGPSSFVAAAARQEALAGDAASLFRRCSQRGGGACRRPARRLGTPGARTGLGFRRLPGLLWETLPWGASAGCSSLF